MHLPESLKQALKRIASWDNIPVSQFFEMRAAQSTREAADQAWAKVGSLSPLPHDRWIPEE